MPTYRFRNGQWVRQGATVTDPDIPDILPTGPDYISYTVLKARAQLAGIADPDLQQVFNTLTEAKIVTMPPGVYETKRLWGKAPYESGKSAPAAESAFRPPKICRGIWGSGRGSLGKTDVGTIIRVTPNTCVSAAEGGSWMQSGGSGSGSFIFKNMQVAGTDQGRMTARILDDSVPPKEKPGGDGISRKLFTNYFASNHGGQFIAEDCLFTGSYGNNGAPPGETFNFQVYGCDFAILRRIESDGRRVVGGPSFASVGITQGNSFGAEWYDCWSHHVNGKTYHMVYFQTAGCKTYNCRLGDPSDLDGYGDFSGNSNGAPLIANTSPANPGFTGGGFNQERAMLSEHRGMFIYNNRKGPGNPDKSVHFNHSGDADYSRVFQGKTYYQTADQDTLIEDCSWFNHWGKAGNPLYVSTWIPYGGDTNGITKTPRVINNGVYQTIMWSAGTSPIARQTPYTLGT